MFSIKKCLIAVPLLIILISCSNDETETIKSSTTAASATAQKLTSVELSIYKNNSLKAQPELINMFTNFNSQDTLDKFSKWIQSDNPTVSIDASNINKIYLMQLDYDKNTKYFLYIQSTDKFYIKQIEEVSELQLDKYNPSQNGYLIKIAGKNGWVATSEIPE